MNNRIKYKCMNRGGLTTGIPTIPRIGVPNPSWFLGPQWWLHMCSATTFSPVQHLAIFGRAIHPVVTPYRSYIYLLFCK